MQDKEEERSLINVEARLNKEGYTQDFRVTEDNRLQALTGDKSYSVEEVKIVDFFRFEGETNPDDMAILYAIECTDGTKGTISNSYGPYADQSIDAFLKMVEDRGKNLDKSDK
ncbi:hypothetical protein ACD591_18920 [Rufibacter glacialis]|uniref:Phosphoribosylpyrophosphate synthetase n=1 Tax=Rufibacter glacialis TaxID=1259555 RepID=A0A5M8QTB7_9BACT|nr:hypothetical protein [Rufibacter glacialis]KAA6438104.1 hypothetical protein FOE74_00230 [Rufibacter glacialis]GGK88596.1 hypothetical protein GCM10011405_40430 [Rufibacter glacialis]